MTHMSKMGGPADLLGTEEAKAVPFGQWVLGHGERSDFIGQLAVIAKTDRGFPRNGDPEAVRKRLGDTGADPEMFDALDDAELDCAAL
jgi:hypothetical protein